MSGLRRLNRRNLKAILDWGKSRRTPIYYFDEVQNFGDEIGPFIAHSKTGRPCYNVRHLPWSPKIAYCTAGSLLHSLSKENCSVWGAGFICQPSIQRPKASPVEVRALRGPISAKIAETLGWGACFCVGDPGLILPDFFSPTLSGKRDVTIIPNYRFARRAGIAKVSRFVVYPWQGLEHVAREIAASELVVASSLHGLILAEAYRVPWVWWREQDDDRKGGEMKFHDFFESLSISSPPSVTGAFFDHDNWVHAVGRMARLGDDRNLASRQDDLRRSMPSFSLVPEHEDSDISLVQQTSEYHR